MRTKEDFPPNLTSFAIKCECGFEIPVVPKAGRVGGAIDAHAEEHKRKKLNEAEGENEAEQVRNDLIRQAFEKISQVCI